jgi:DNA-binding winged helix-turn-helix (wHTH) protein/TolB-like protein
MSRNFSTLYRFGPYRLAPDERRLQRGEEDVHLTPKAFDLLVLLVREAGHLQCRDALIEQLWGHTVVEEHGLTWNVSALRRALGDCGESPAYIETVRGHGYRFVATVRVETEAMPAASSATPRPPDRLDPGQPALPPTPPGTRHRLRPRLKPRWWWLTGAAMAVALAVALVPRQHASTGAKHRMHAARPTIAIVGFRNLSNDHDYDWIGDALAEMLGTDLVTGRTADLVPAADVMRAVRDLTPGEDKDFPAPAQLQRLRSMLGADASITGAYLRQRGPGDPRIRVDVQLVVHRHGTPAPMPPPITPAACPRWLRARRCWHAPCCRRRSARNRIFRWRIRRWPAPGWTWATTTMPPPRPAWRCATRPACPMRNASSCSGSGPRPATSGRRPSMPTASCSKPIPTASMWA